MPAPSSRPRRPTTSLTSPSGRPSAIARSFSDKRPAQDGRRPGGPPRAPPPRSARPAPARGRCRSRAAGRRSRAACRAGGTAWTAPAMPACWLGDMGEGARPEPLRVGDVAHRPDPAVGDGAQVRAAWRCRAAPASTLPAGRSRPDSRGARPTASSRCVPATRAPSSSTAHAGRRAAASAVQRSTRATRAPFADLDAVARGARARGPRPAPRPRAPAMRGAASSTVTRQPRRAWACAISSPIGPPPRTSRWPGGSSRSKSVSLVSQGTPSRPGRSGTTAARAGGDDAAAEGRGAGRRASIASGPTKWAEASITSTPMPRKRAAESLGAMRAIAPLDMRAHARPVDLRRRQADAEAPGLARLGGGMGGGEQRLGRARSRSSGSRRPCGRARPARPSARARRRWRPPRARRRRRRSPPRRSQACGDPSLSLEARLRRRPRRPRAPRRAGSAGRRRRAATAPPARASGSRMPGEKITPRSGLPPASRTCPSPAPMPANTTVPGMMPRKVAAA